MSDKKDINQPTKAEDVSPQQKEQQKQTMEQGENLIANPGDRNDESKSLEDKAQQVAVDAPDITGDHVTVPTYFVAEDKETGEKEALHHVKDAEEISDVIRQARTDEEGNRTWR